MRHLVVLSLVLGGCTASSRLEPDEPLSALGSGETAQLCRFTVDQLAGVDTPCFSHSRDFDACVAAPPWDACPPGDRTADVGSWEACVRASSACMADADSCWHVACL